MRDLKRVLMEKGVYLQIVRGGLVGGCSCFVLRYVY
jgi:hypothetical protein